MIRKVNLIPLAGSGSRFKNNGYIVPKPLLRINGKPMFVRATNSLPKANKYIFVCLENHIKKFSIDKIIKFYFPKSEIIALKRKTSGQAITCLKAIKLLKENDILTIGSCDYSMKYNQNILKKKLKNSDLIIWTFKNKLVVKKNPKMYGYVKTNKKGLVTKVTCKKVVSEKPWNDHTIIGTFSFKKAKYFIDFTKKLLKNNLRVNNEFYLDTVAELCVKSGLNVKVNLVDKYFGWGTPSDLKKYLIKNTNE